MPDKQLTMAGYAAGASLAAITLVYVFAPTFFIDGEAAGASPSSRKKGVVGLWNPANDCFINSILQALAGLGDLRVYLIRETHRRKLDGPGVYMQLVQDSARKGMPDWKIESLQTGMVTQGLKDILDALNERPLYKKTISAGGFVGCLEAAFKQRISRQQQDAQEFLQVVAERVCDEYHAGHRARNYARKTHKGTGERQTLDEEPMDRNINGLAFEKGAISQQPPTISALESEGSPEKAGKETSEQAQSQDEEGKNNYDDEDGFPLEGGSESQIECLTCGFKPKATTTTFCSVTLSVPQVSSTSLSSCFDGMFKTEYIEDFKCEKCRLIHGLETFQQELLRSNSERFKVRAQDAIDKLQAAIDTNPEEGPKDIEMPDRKFAPKRKIAKHVRITKFPKVMAIHLSRSIFDAGSSTMKNSAKVSFQERLPLGGILNQRIYKLSSVVCHKGSHHSGHYESFRRQTLLAPFSTPNTFHTASVYSKPPSPLPLQISTPQLGAVQKYEDSSTDESTISSTPEISSPTSASTSSLPYINSTSDEPRTSSRTQSSLASASASSATTRPPPTSVPRDSDTGSIRSFARSTRSRISRVSSNNRSSTPTTPSISIKIEATSNTSAKETLSIVSDVVRGKRKKNPSNRWWRISDEKIKESRTSDVLGMQKEVYMLFYELEHEDLSA